MKNICVLCSGGGSNLQALIDSAREGRLTNGRIALVISSREGAYALERAEQAGIPNMLLNRKQFADMHDFSRALEALLEPAGIDLIIQAGFIPRLDEQLCRRYENRIMNIHPSLLPAFGGKGHYGIKVHEAALRYGAKVTGATVHFVSAELDAGPVIAQRAIPVLPDDTAETLQQRVMRECEWQLLPEAAALFCQDRLTVQDGLVHIQ